LSIKINDIKFFFQISRNSKTYTLSLVTKVTSYSTTTGIKNIISKF